METDNKSGKYTKEEKDEIIGRALSRAMKASAPAENCPPLEDIAAFIDGKLGEQERDSLMGHFSRCDRCYQVFSLAQEMGKEGAGEGAGEGEGEGVGVGVGVGVGDVRKCLNEAAVVYTPTTVRSTNLLKARKAARMAPRGIRIYVPIAFAAAAVLIIALMITLKHPMQDKISVDIAEMPKSFIPPFSTEIVGMLLKNPDFKPPTGSTMDGPLVALAKMKIMTLEENSFAIGIYLTNLEFFLSADDKAGSLSMIKRIVLILQSIEGSEDVISFYDDMAKKIEKGTSTKEFLGKTEKVESFLKDKNVILHLQFGEWVEGGRLTTPIGAAEFLDIESVNYFIENFKGKDLPKATFTELKEIKKILAKDPLADDDFKQLKMAFNNIVRIMW